jgi:hypothetical protein
VLEKVTHVIFNHENFILLRVFEPLHLTVEEARLSEVKRMFELEVPYLRA